MVFNSFEYALFLPLVLLVYWRLSHRRQNLLLLVASYVFYGAWDPRFLALMAFSTVTDYTVGLLLSRNEGSKVRSRIFLVSLFVNLGILAAFKYFDFFVSSAMELLEVIGFQAHAPTLRVILPVGISFYTFHGISYTFDVYRRDIEPARDLLSFACFISFFPQLVAGPIGRAHIQLPQFEHPRVRPSREQFRSALVLILIGLFKKVAIADALAPLVDRTFADPGATGAAGLLVGMYAFALQIYGDFSGYSDMARGSARLLGVELPRNFEQPYLSSDVTDFWRRWHISLSTWLRDYLYVPLGGNRGGRAATYRNLFVTMLLGGLWHGAAFTFVVWGALHGIYLIVHRAWSSRAGARPILGGNRVLASIGTFHLVCFAWVFFRAESLGAALRYVWRIAIWHPGPVPIDGPVLLGFALLGVFAIDLIQRRSEDETAMLRWTPAASGLVYGLFLVAVVLFSGAAPVPFIYFQF